MMASVKLKDYDNPYFMKNIFFNLIEESDRGCVLLGFSYLENRIKEHLSNIIPKDFTGTKKEKENIIKNNLDNHLNNLYAFGYISYSLLLAIRELKKIRNKIAHNMESFKLAKYKSQLDIAYKYIGENTNYFLAEKSIDIILMIFIENALNLRMKDDTNITYFQNEHEVIKYLSNNKELITKLESEQPKVEFALCINLIDAILDFNFNKKNGTG